MTDVSVSAIADQVRAARPRLPSTRLVLIDGPAGSGKTTLANQLALELGGSWSAGAGSFEPGTAPTADAPVQILHADDMYEGWGGLAVLDSVLVDQVLEPLRAGRAGAFRMWDWGRGERTHLITVEPRSLLIVEGVGVASPAARRCAALTLWVEAPREERLRRGIARDGEAMRAEWERWQDSEEQALEEMGARDAAALIVDGTADLSPGTPPL